MGETLDKLSVKYQNKCPIHNEPYTGVCVEKGCYETGVICPKCNPRSCIDISGHKLMSMDDFFENYLKHVIQAIDFNALNKLISLGREVQTKKIELESKTYEEWELKFINDKFDKFRERLTKKLKNFIENLINKLDIIY